MPLTDDQMESLKLNDDSGKEKANIELYKWEAEIVRGSISDDKLRQAVSQDMLKAQDTADEILDAAGKEVMNLLAQEGKDKVDQETEDEKEFFLFLGTMGASAQNKGGQASKIVLADRDSVWMDSSHNLSISAVGPVTCRASSIGVHAPLSIEISQGK